MVWGVERGRGWMGGGGDERVDASDVWRDQTCFSGKLPRNDCLENRSLHEITRTFALEVGMIVS